MTKTKKVSPKQWQRKSFKEAHVGAFSVLILTQNDGNCDLSVVSKPLMAVGKSVYCVYTLITPVLWLIEANFSATSLAFLKKCLVITPCSSTIFLICTVSKIELIY